MKASQSWRSTHSKLGVRSRDPEAYTLVFANRGAATLTVRLHVVLDQRSLILSHVLIAAGDASR